MEVQLENWKLLRVVCDAGCQSLQSVCRRCHSTFTRHPWDECFTYISDGQSRAVGPVGLPSPHLASTSLSPLHSLPVSALLCASTWGFAAPLCSWRTHAHATDGNVLWPVKCGHGSNGPILDWGCISFPRHCFLLSTWDPPWKEYVPGSKDTDMNSARALESSLAQANPA